MSEICTLVSLLIEHFDTNVILSKYTVKIDRTCLIPEIRNWLSENSMDFRIYEEVGLEYEFGAIIFIKEEDAMAFKLAWY